MKPNHTIICNIHNYEDMSVEEINALIDELCGLRQTLIRRNKNEQTNRPSYCLQSHL